MEKLKLKPGVVTGDALTEVFDYCQSVQCALPAVNVISTSSINAAIESARASKAPVIVQFSHSGAAFVAGKFLSNEGQKASIAGAVSGALHAREMAKAYGVPVILHTDHAARKLIPWVEGLLDVNAQYFEKEGAPLFSSHMLDLSEDSLEENLATCKDVLAKMAPLGMTLEIELGITGGEEDGVDNSDVDSSRLYTQPSEVLRSYDVLNPVGNFSVAASFGNTHGVYKPGNVQLRPDILKNSQDHIKAERNTADSKPVHFVFHGGSGSSKEEITEAVSYGVVKMNIDTDTQWAYTQPIKQYMDKYDGYLHSQLGNPEGPDQPNKKRIDPRGWTHEGEKGMAARLVQAFKDLNAFDKFDF